MEEKYEPLKERWSVKSELARLVVDKKTKELFAVKYIERGEKIDENVQREIINHRSLRHPNIVKFKEVFLTPTHVAIVMEYAAGGELFAKTRGAGRFSENKARYFFQQLISGVGYCHSMEICNRDLKLENIFLDGRLILRLKIYGFSYSKSGLLNSQPKWRVSTQAVHIAPEVLTLKEYDGKIADVWSCGVTLYVMLVGAYPFEDPEDPTNIRETIGRIMSVQYSIPDYVAVSADCRDLLSHIFVADPSKRITLPEIRKHPWFLKNLPKEAEKTGPGLQRLMQQFQERSTRRLDSRMIRSSYRRALDLSKVGSSLTSKEDADSDENLQSVDEIMRIIQEAKSLGQVSNADDHVGTSNSDNSLGELH